VDRFPVGASATLAQLEHDPHPLLARLREREPVSWLPALGGWLVTSREHVLAAMSDAETFTVADERFSTGRVVGESMLTLDGAEHSRHREPWVPAFRSGAIQREPVHRATTRLLDALEPAGEADLRAGYAAPLAAAVITDALGLENPEVVQGWYEAIVGAVNELTAGALEVPAAARAAFAELREAVTAGSLPGPSPASNAAVVLFGGVETTEAMISNAILHLLEHPQALEQVRGDTSLVGAAIEESLRLEPAAAVIDRYATRDVELGGAAIAAGDLVRLSLAGANRDPSVFSDPDRFQLGRPNVRLQLAFARGPHVCLGVHLARLEAQTAIALALERLPRLRLDRERPSAISGLVFRKPPSLWVRWG
jgi:cytochrome P450